MSLWSCFQEVEFPLITPKTLCAKKDGQARGLPYTCPPNKKSPPGGTFKFYSGEKCIQHCFKPLALACFYRLFTMHSHREVYGSVTFTAQASQVERVKHKRMFLAFAGCRLHGNDVMNLCGSTRQTFFTATLAIRICPERRHSQVSPSSRLYQLSVIMVFRHASLPPTGRKF